MEAVTSVSIREFARLDGCNDKLVRRAIQDGKLTALADGKLDPALAGTGWRRLNRRDKPEAVSVAPTVPATAPALTIQALDGESAADAAARIIASKFPMLSLADAEIMKENYVALLRQLEYDQKAGLVVLVENVTSAVGKKFSAVRSRLLAIPAEQAPKLHRLKTVAEVQDALQEIITRALEELTRGEFSGV